MVHAKGVTVSVIVDGAPLKEHKESTTESTTDSTQTSGTETNCYIESEVGKCFEIMTTCDDSAFKGCKMFDIAVFVDGTRISKSFLQSRKKNSSLIVGPSTKIKGRWNVQPMLFADLKIGRLALLTVLGQS